MAESGVTEAGLKATLVDKVDALHVDIEDMSGGCGQAFSAIIVSPQFARKTVLARHRLVNAALRTEIAAIHAWTPKCYTPEEWERQGGTAVAPGKQTTGEVVNGTRE
ncbi:MAG: hypothetical protein M1818_003196 [Claussenomyces sp. TS43310]|nr:MAG: hypothetical protein M1818_003196 [Claussenomyces sp. TS43310]